MSDKKVNTLTFGGEGGVQGHLLLPSDIDFFPDCIEEKMNAGLTALLNLSNNVSCNKIFDTFPESN